jgi:hypothetical protein
MATMFFRNPESFRIILSYLRTGLLDDRPYPSKKFLQFEAVYFGLQDLVEDLEQVVDRRVGTMLFICGLAPGTTKAFVEEEFQKSGNVLEVTQLANGTTAVVYMSNESWQKAVADLNGSSIGGRIVKVWREGS